ncbi:hypothetical protein PQX77_016459 [Marasmius sp. AFHP31]|nr:hypothetical protein PQX77_016459 [Marasmius sp. AFHP31]
MASRFQPTDGDYGPKFPFPANNVLEDLQVRIRDLESKVEEHDQVLGSLKRTRHYAAEPPRKRVGVDDHYRNAAQFSNETFATPLQPPTPQWHDVRSSGSGYPVAMAPVVQQQHTIRPPQWLLDATPWPPPAQPQLSTYAVTPPQAAWVTNAGATPRTPPATMGGAHYPYHSSQHIQTMPDSHPYHIHVSNMPFNLNDHWEKVAKSIVELVPAGRHCSNRVRGRRNDDQSFTVMFMSEMDAMSFYNDWMDGNAPQKVASVVMALGFYPGQPVGM